MITVELDGCVWDRNCLSMFFYVNNNKNTHQISNYNRSLLVWCNLYCSPMLSFDWLGEAGVPEGSNSAFTTGISTFFLFRLISLSSRKSRAGGIR